MIEDRSLGAAVNIPDSGVLVIGGRKEMDYLSAPQSCYRGGQVKEEVKEERNGNGVTSLLCIMINVVFRSLFISKGESTLLAVESTWTRWREETTHNPQSVSDLGR
ncbi:unnamed protein product [Hymenolepis diminuta]|uniref:Uncharacterized protein n=1 Tax=Hymenolepis diminuta TaxID=6216 RepID=A0A0R3SJL0_HYMDI|nr:unnamed protein product [Hymenolepis diminuta]